jgi:predicted DNA-binding transcriptional regulator AlpA
MISAEHGGSKLLRAKDVGGVFGITESGVYNLARAGVLPHVAFKTKGNRNTVRFWQQDLDSFIQGHLCGGREAGR